MKNLFPDTHPQVTIRLIEMMREVPPARKFEMVAQMNQTVKTMMLAGLKSRHPNDTPEILRRRMADLVLGPALALKVYGPITWDEE
jgi:hypothetical protein